MNDQIPSFIVDRISQKPFSKYVVKGSTPVPFFGNFTGASSYTIGINPSLQEFQSSTGELLGSEEKRLEDFQSLGILTSESSYQILAGHSSLIYLACLNYFDRNPYHWFNIMDEVVNRVCKSSYFDGSACHLDLVQWATDPIWSTILRTDPEEATNLSTHDLLFLNQQINWIRNYNENLKRFVLSGKTVVNSLSGIFNLKYVGKTQVSGKNKQYSLYRGDFLGIPVYGTSMNIPDSHTSSLHRDYLSAWIGEQERMMK